jgi:hypothetical protein
MYYWSMRAWTELSMICVVIVTTVFWVDLSHSMLTKSIDIGIYAGIGFSLLLLVRAAGYYSMKPLKRDPESGSFLAVDDARYQVYVSLNFLLIQFYPFALMVKIATDNLTFVNTGFHCSEVCLIVARIKEGLHRLERYGTFDVHPSEQRTRFAEDNVNVVFDFSGVTFVDPRSPISPYGQLTLVQPRCFVRLLRGTAPNAPKCISWAWSMKSRPFSRERGCGNCSVPTIILRRVWRSVCDL